MNKRDFFKQRVNPEDNYLTTPINLRPIYDLHKKKHKKAKKHKKKTKKTYSDDEMEEQPRMTDKQKQQILLTKELEGEIQQICNEYNIQSFKDPAKINLVKKKLNKKIVYDNRFDFNAAYLDPG